MKTICIRCQQMIGGATGCPGASHGLCSACEGLWLEERLRDYYRDQACALHTSSRQGTQSQTTGGRRSGRARSRRINSNKAATVSSSRPSRLTKT